MHPTFNKGRREARVRHLARKYSEDRQVWYTDIAQHPRSQRTTIVALTPQGEVATAASYCSLSPTTAEDIAIAHAATTHQNQPQVTVLSDCQQACRLYQYGRVPESALRLLRSLPEDLEITIVWTPGHSGLAENEAAHAAARDLHFRAFPSSRQDASSYQGSTILSLTPLDPTYNAILSHYLHPRRIYSPPHPTLSSQQSHI